MSELARRPNASSQEVMVTGIFARLESELRHLAQIADQLQEAIGELVSEAPPAPRRSFVSKAQNLDILVQSLHGIATYLAILTRTVPESWMLDPGEAVRAVKLSNLAQRLLEDAVRHSDEKRGELDLF